MAVKINKSFAEQVKFLTEKYQQRLRAVAKTSVQETVSIASTVRDEGGRMRVDTGFLWHSCVAAIGAMPIGESKPPTDGGVFSFDGSEIAVVLLKWDLTEDLYVGWTANYAKYREHYDGFLGGALELWQDTVAKNVAKAKRMI